VEADLREADWAAAAAIGPTAGGRQFDAIVTATALHWLPPADLERLYRDLASSPGQAASSPMATTSRSTVCRTSGV